MDQSLTRPGMTAPAQKFVIGGIVIAVTLIGLVLWAMNRPGSTAFYLTTSELAEAGPTPSGEMLRLNGNVVEGSVDRSGLETTFAVTDGVTEVTVFTDRPLPDSFRDDSETEVVALGAFDGRRFTASEVLAKCPSKFKARA